MTDNYLLYVNQLTGEYKDTFKYIEMYVSTENVDENTKNELLGSLMDTFLTAQNEGKPVKKITGRNLERFCKEFCSDFSFKQHFINVVERLSWLMVVMGITVIFNLLDFFVKLSESEASNFWDFKSDDNIFSYILIFAFAMIVDCFINFAIKK